jgi:hypothetical protein
MKQYLKLAFVFTVLAVAYACNKNGSSTDLTADAVNQPLKIYITDAPVKLDTVNLDIKYVEVKLDTNSAHKHDDHFGDHDIDSLNNLSHKDAFGHWDTLQFAPKVYNIAALRNGLDQLLAAGNITGTIRKIRITLGTNNTVVDSGITYPLILNTNYKYVYANINNNHHQKDSLINATLLWIDFDLFKSIRKVNNTYYLFPVLKPFSEQNFASGEGKVTPYDAKPLITVYNNTDTAYGVPNHDGYYKIRALQQGNYNVSFKASNGYKDTTITNVQFVNGKVTKLPNIVLHK